MTTNEISREPDLFQISMLEYFKIGELAVFLENFLELSLFQDPSLTYFKVTETLLSFS